MHGAFFKRKHVDKGMVSFLYLLQIFRATTSYCVLSLNYLVIARLDKSQMCNVPCISKQTLKKIVNTQIVYFDQFSIRAYHVY